MDRRDARAAAVTRRTLLKGASAAAISVALSPAFARVRPLADPRIERLIAAMSLEEKAGQLSIFSDPARTDGPPLNPGLARQSMDDLKKDIAAGRMTGLYNG